MKWTGKIVGKFKKEHLNQTHQNRVAQMPILSDRSFLSCFSQFDTLQNTEITVVISGGHGGVKWTNFSSCLKVR